MSGTSGRQGGICGDTIPNGEQAGIAADGYGVAPHHFQTVFIGRVVASGDHDAAVKAVGEYGMIHFFGAAKAYARHVHSGSRQTVRQGGIQGRTGKARVMADDDPFRTYLGGVGETDAAGQIFIKSGWYFAAHVIGFKACERHPASRSRLPDVRCRPHPDKDRIALR